MPNIASILKAEISRVARKEVRAEVQALKKSTSTYRSEISALKRRIQELEQNLRRLGKTKPTPKTEAASETDQNLRFSAKGLASTRKRLGLSAQECGLLVGASGQSIYKWELGKARPRASNLPGLVALRTMGKKEAAQRLATLGNAG
ncbi:hypothetical protein BurJ1DRAFT_3260 [Burkholderiales bacterium JOSHI_001]|nr:hypothetical protein BurJ1DRAFT_3260 [Burkholderiales bacterium JOSHI_001]